MARGIENALTDAGRALIARSIAEGSPIVFSGAKVGTGLLPDTQDPAKQTSLIAPYADADINGSSADESANLIISVRFSNQNVLSSVYLEEIGVYAKLQQDAESILFSYLSFGAYPSVILAADVQGMDRTFDLPFSFGSGSTVSVEISPSGLVSASDVSDVGIPGKIVRANHDGKLDVSIIGDASTLQGKDPSDFAEADHSHDVASQTSSGFMSPVDKRALDLVAKMRRRICHRRLRLFFPDLRLMALFPALGLSKLKEVSQWQTIYQGSAPIMASVLSATRMLFHAQSSSQRLKERGELQNKLNP